MSIIIQEHKNFFSNENTKVSSKNSVFCALLFWFILNIQFKFIKYGEIRQMKKLKVVIDFVTENSNEKPMKKEKDVGHSIDLKWSMLQSSIDTKNRFFLNVHA